MGVYFFIFTVLVGFVAYSFFRSSKKKVDPFPRHWHDLLKTEVEFYRDLNTDEQCRFQQRMMQFLSEVYIDSVNIDISELRYHFDSFQWYYSCICI